jgi:hypothetical protein
MDIHDRRETMGDRHRHRRGMGTNRLALGILVHLVHLVPEILVRLVHLEILVHLVQEGGVALEQGNRAQEVGKVLGKEVGLVLVLVVVPEPVLEEVLVVVPEPVQEEVPE